MGKFENSERASPSGASAILAVLSRQTRAKPADDGLRASHYYRSFWAAALNRKRGGYYGLDNASSI